MAAGCSRWPALAPCPATPGTAACNSPGSDCPVCKSTAHAHLGEQPQNNTAQPGSLPVLRDPVGQLSLATDLTRGLQAPSRASGAVASHRRIWDTYSLLWVASSCPVALLAQGWVWGHAPGTEHTAPSIPTLPKGPPVPYQSRCCCAGLVGTWLPVAPEPARCFGHSHCRCVERGGLRSSFQHNPPPPPLEQLGWELLQFARERVQMAQDCSRSGSWALLGVMPLTV